MTLDYRFPRALSVKPGTTQCQEKESGAGPNSTVMPAEMNLGKSESQNLNVFYNRQGDIGTTKTRTSKSKPLW